MELSIGTSGYSYPHWGNGVFYPQGIPPEGWLEFYSRQFNAVELNVTFYRLPDVPTVKAWHKQTPGEFRFVVKGSRFITHIKRLKDAQESLRMLGDNLAPLRSKLTCFLWQLPPEFKRDDQRLSDFCRLLSALGRRHVFEFRNETWLHRDVYAILKDFQCCLCFADSPEKLGEHVLTTDFAYLRFHGGTAFYASNYSRKELEGWADKVAAMKNRVKTLYAFFNNDEQGFAVYNAQSFRMFLLERKLS
jgi:uncharacterized protein YecE (DUF72 family)